MAFGGFIGGLLLTLEGAEDEDNDEDEEDEEFPRKCHCCPVKSSLKLVCFKNLVEGSVAKVT